MEMLPGNSQCQTSGSVYLAESHGRTNLLALPENKMRRYRGNRISMIFQEPMTSLNPVFTCGGQIVEAIRAHQHVGKSEAKAQTLELFRKVELKQPKRIFSSYPHQLS